MKRKINFEEVGWVGMVLVLVAYFFVSQGILSKENLIYVLLNFVGSLGLAIISYKKKAISLTVFYSLWAIISLI